MDKSTIAQLIFTLNVAREIASWEGPELDIVVYRVQQAIEATREEAARYGIVVEIEHGPDHKQ
ncbi:hypothetical protein JNB88_30760 [Rhizobium cauense]|uniref:hypothetical protein n=1 Tax=Rhizobium cauense TaxID=1166683 RepID=UPI001C6F2305|nr:hypothetical protein [Rhizobium cauense]MBW9118000.1 hypothetical protein [Rhizobium cauense]